MPTFNTPRQLNSATQSIDRTTEGRIPPQANDVEMAVLGALLLEKNAFAEISQMLKPESFYVKAHETIYSCIRELSLENQPIDLLSVSQRLKQEEKLDEVGGIAYLSELTNRVVSAANLTYHAAIVGQKSLSRQLIKFATDILTKAYDDTEDVEDQMQAAEGALFEISQSNMRKDVLPISIVVNEAVNEINAAANDKENGGISGIPSGFPGIDAMTAGWQNSDLIIIAARPAIGKTAFVLSMAKYIAVDHHIPVALFNLEMSSVQLVKRLISNVCELPGEKLKNGQLVAYEWLQLHERVKVLEDAPLFIDDTPSLSVFELQTKARRLVQEHGIRMIIIDYLQLMNASGMSYGNREQEISTISRSLKILAKELNIPVVALSQLNRAVETRKADSGSNSKIPQLSDLRESGAIEQDADMVCFLHRPEAYKIYQDEYGDTKGIGYFIIAKHRNGPIGDVRIGFRGEFAKFHPLEEVRIIPGGIHPSKITGNDASETEPTSTSAPLSNMGTGAEPISPATFGSMSGAASPGFSPFDLDEDSEFPF